MKGCGTHVLTVTKQACDPGQRLFEVACLTVVQEPATPPEEKRGSLDKSASNPELALPLGENGSTRILQLASLSGSVI